MALSRAPVASAFDLAFLSAPFLWDKLPASATLFRASRDERPRVARFGSLWVFARLGCHNLRAYVGFLLDSVAKLWLRLRLNRDSVDRHFDSRGVVDDGAARARTGSILLQV